MIQFLGSPVVIRRVCQTGICHMRHRDFFYRMDEEALMGLSDDDWGGSYQSIQVRAFSSW